MKKVMGVAYMPEDLTGKEQKYSNTQTQTEIQLAEFERETGSEI